jgi:hypothetical protein
LLLLKKGKTVLEEGVEEHNIEALSQVDQSQDLAKVLAMLNKIDTRLGRVDAKVQSLAARLTALEALQSSKQARGELEVRFRNQCRKRLRQDNLAALKEILFIERVKGNDKSTTWWAWLGDEKWDQKDKDALGDNVVSIVRELIRKERTHLADQVRSAIQGAYGGEFPEFPGAGAKPSVEMQQKVATWGAALEKAQIPEADKLGDYVHTLASVTVKVFGEAARVDDLVFCIWIYQHWHHGKSLAQTSAATPYKQWHDCCAELREGEELLREALTNVQPKQRDLSDDDEECESAEKDKGEADA